MLKNCYTNYRVVYSHLGWCYYNVTNPVDAFNFKSQIMFLTFCFGYILKKRFFILHLYLTEKISFEIVLEIS